MTEHPFSIFEPYHDDLEVCLYTKGDLPMKNKHIVSLNQVHGNKTVIVRSPSAREKTADGMLTDESGLCLTLRVSDCQGFVAYAPEQQVIGVLHAGWRGLVNGVIGSFFETMQNEWQMEPSTLYVAAAPSLCMRCAEFSDPVRELAGIDHRFFDGRHADLRAIADDQLRRCGILRGHIERHLDCTKCRNDAYWSYRGGDSEEVRKGSTNILTCRLKKRQ
jgi:polyphenol oxidase